MRQASDWPELIGLDDKDVDFETMQLKVTGKRNKQRIVPFGEELRALLRTISHCATTRWNARRRHCS